MAEFAVLRQCVPLPGALFEGQFLAAQTLLATAPELHASSVVRTALATAAGAGPCPFACEVTGPLTIDVGGAVFLTIAPVPHEGALYINERLRALARLAARTLGGGNHAAARSPLRQPGTEQGRVGAAWRRTARIVRSAMAWLMPVGLTPRLIPEDVVRSADLQLLVPNRAAGMPTVSWADLVETVAWQRGISRPAALRRILLELATNRRRWKLSVHPWLGRYVDVAYRAMWLLPLSGAIAKALFSPTMMQHYSLVVELLGAFGAATDVLAQALAAAANVVAQGLRGVDLDELLRQGGGTVEQVQTRYMRFLRHLLNLPWLVFWPILLGAAVNFRFGALERYQRRFLARITEIGRELTVFMNQLTSLVNAATHSTFFQLIPYVLQFIAFAGRVMRGLLAFLWSLGAPATESERPLGELDVGGGVPRFASRALALADEYWRNLGSAWAVELAAVAGALKERLSTGFAYAAIGGFFQNARLDVTDSFMAIAARDYAAGAVSAFYEYAHAIRLHVVMGRDWRTVDAPRSEATATMDALVVDFAGPYMATGSMLFTFCRHMLGVVAPGSPLWTLLGVSDRTIVTSLTENMFPTDNLADNAAQRMAAEFAGLPGTEPTAERSRLAEYRDLIKTLEMTTTVKPVAQQHANLGINAECTAALFGSLAALSTAFGGSDARGETAAEAARAAASTIGSALSNRAYRMLRERIGHDYADGPFLDKWVWRLAYALTHRTSYFGDAWRFLFGIYQTPAEAGIGADELARRWAEREAGAHTFDTRVIPAPVVVETIFHFRFGGRASDWFLRPAAAAGGWTLQTAAAALLQLRPSWGALALPAAVLVTEIVAPDAVVFVALQIGSRALLGLLGGRGDPNAPTVTGSRRGPSTFVVEWVQSTWLAAAARVRNLPGMALLALARAQAEAVWRALGAFVARVAARFGAAAAVFVETAVVDALRIGYDVFADYMNQRVIVTTLISVVLFFLGDIEWVATAAAFAEPLLLYGSCLLRLVWAAHDMPAFAALAPGAATPLPAEERSARPLRQYLLALHMGGRTVEWSADRVDFTAVKLHRD